jgi:hypothetical protein
MPATSQAQYRAMQAAAHGKSTLGIPQSVGKEFADATSNVSSLPKRLTSLAKRRKANRHTSTAQE